ncbi:putative polysaccharide biosynthesis protein [Clostridium fallax]|uniref:Stage V sporulation protein B n=1 Tax=Clostridium fallax TaxID=1533 RepID=A0A1M4TDZ4_9CLOT|nr:polysaccharide biosynthesis protein [Clostridium fallax]SHE42769.1 stage V sporulation protein B [Clostridium fallax]SQB22722.1 stage V sporulation protein B [Clostridium fallax]
MEKQSLIKGSIILGFAGILAKILGVFFRWPIIMLLGDEGVGYYQMPFPMYMIFIAFVGGIPIAISKLVSESIARGNENESFEIMRQALIFITILALGMSTILIIGAKTIINFLKWDPKVYFSFIAMALAPLMVSFVTAYRGFFQGMQNMYPTAISQVLEQVGRVLAGVGLAWVLLPYGIGYAAGGAALGAGIGGILGGLYLHIKYSKIKRRSKVKVKFINKKIMDKIFKIAVPIGLGMLVSNLMTLADSILIPQLLLKAGFSNNEITVLFAQFSGKANVLVNLPLSLSVALSSSLIPIIAEHYALKQFRQLKNKITISMKFSFIIAFPSFLGLFFLARPILDLIFPGQGSGYDILKYLSISIPFIIICQTTTSVLQACDKLKQPIIFLLLGVIIKVILTIYLVPINTLGIYGAIIATIIGYSIPAMLNSLYMKFMIKNELMEKNIDYFDVMAKPAMASLIMIISVMFSYIYIIGAGKSMKIASLISISLGIIIYLLLILILGIFKNDYIKNKFNKR